MKFICTLALLFSVNLLFGQPPTAGTPHSELLSRADIDRIFNDGVKKQFNIDFNIFKVFKCDDKSGRFYIVLIEKYNGINEENDTLHTKIRGINFLSTPNGLLKQWELNDFTIKQVNEGDMETSIWFWTKFSEFNDVDKDGLIDPIIIYGTAGMNMYDDGRIKILVYYKGKKIAIRHQNGVLDGQRFTQVDEDFYTLPQVIQNHVKAIMKNLQDKQFAIFPDGWQNAMAKHKLKFDEKH